jgi:hypothetical protein
VTSLFGVLRDRLLPAVLTAAGVTMIAAGLLSYTSTATAANPGGSLEPEILSANPGSSATLPTLPPVDGSPSEGPAPTAASARVATRVVVEALGIDLPVVKPRGTSNTYPQCNVAMYIQELSQPGNDRATYLYAHARDGMFGPIYERALLKQHGGPNSMLGMIVQVYTSDDRLYEYQVTEVRLHETSLDDAVDAHSEELWLQTSEGPAGTPGKTQVVAKPLIVLPADHKAAHPAAHPVNCG